MLSQWWQVRCHGTSVSLCSDLLPVDYIYSCSWLSVAVITLLLMSDADPNCWSAAPCSPAAEWTGRKEMTEKQAKEWEGLACFFLFFFPPLVFYCWHLPLLSIRTVPLPAGGDWRFSCRDTLEVKLHWKQNKKIGVDCGWTVQETSFQSHLAINKWTDFHQNMPGIKLLKRKIAHQRPMILKREADYAHLSQLYISENVCLCV